VLAQRVKLRQAWETQFLQPASEVPHCELQAPLCAGL
jgi:hypothetical protein